MTERPRGTVRRRGGDLVVSIPPAGPSVARRKLKQQLALFAAADPGAEEHEVDVPSARAAELVEVLAGHWPAGLWDWDWSPDALKTARSAEQVRAAVERATGDPEQSGAEDIDGHLLEVGFTRTLLPAQRVAVAQLAAAGSGGNFSVPGSGKTTMTYAVFALLKRAGIVSRMLVVAPQSAYEAWATEAQDCFREGSRPKVLTAPRQITRHTNVLVLNYDRAATSVNRAAIDRWAHGHRLLVVFDEAHRAKRGADGQHGRGAIDLSTMATSRLVLTGTPMPNGPEDLQQILDLAWPGHGARLADPFTPGGERSWVRLTKDQLGLEPAEVVVEEVDLDPAHRRIYDALLVDPLEPDDELLDEGLVNRALMRIIGAASNPALLLNGVGQDPELRWPEHLADPDDLKALLSDIPGTAQPAKLLAAARHAQAHARAGTKLLVWTNFIGNVDELERLLAPYGTAVVTGRTPLEDPAAPTDRVRELRRFREDPRCTVLIATPQTLGEGISLHKVCQAQLHIDRTFNAGLYLQALDRTHRVGMPEGTTARVTVLVARGTIDERIDQALRAKLKAMDEMLNDPTLGRLARVRPAEVDAVGEEVPVEELVKHLRGGT